MCELTDGTFHKTDKSALFFLSFWSSVFHTSVFQCESKTYCWEQFLEGDAVNKLLLGVPFCTPLPVLFLHPTSHRVQLGGLGTGLSLFRYQVLGKINIKQ